MRASHLEFRLRLVVLAAIVSVGFWSPWIAAWGIGQHISMLEWCALQMSRLGLVSFTVATPVMIVATSAIAAVAALLRVWGTAWLGPGVVNNPGMKAGVVIAGGPYRYVRNPLYLGTALMVVAMGFAMPVSGALFSILLIAFFQLRLILGEEAFLSAQLGETYQSYLRTVPRLLPRLRSNLCASSDRPQWGRALLHEANPIGVFLVIAVLSWHYENILMIKGFLVSLGISLVLRALLPANEPALASS